MSSFAWQPNEIKARELSRTMNPTIEAGASAKAGSDPHIDVGQVSKSFRPTGGGRGGQDDSRAVVALEDTSFQVRRGEFVSVVGPSGCGKTTLLRMIAGLSPVDTGQINVGGKRVAGPGPDRAVVFQHAALLPWASVVDNISFGLRLRKTPKAQRTARARDLAALVGLAGFENHLPGQLSGGMQQRVGLARALAVDPQILLLDEPFGALDEITRRQMQDELLRIWSGTGLTSLLITHSVDEAIFLSDRILVMSGRPGRVIEEIAVPMGRPREREMERTPEFVDLREHVWRLLSSPTVADAHD
jgi:ABC-type nitrate/sulfonate/bicarbonate transport system ATPase subunit